ncbi:MAG TPA: hypothetical protein ENO08_02405 [Candidatus Eisenbacteria bacterium]|uniref:Delta-aminolevulinic acid dehydratase n=1 Tax=Eiseniibacteriota bacterium TaxID=2212470 RepID=A0A7V2AU52_UNCEI|nr:hypothetical protein [Candidatus Eisenbacteria bacterium]
MDLKKITDGHYEALKRAGFRGYDVYDGLNSRIFRKTPCFGSKNMRIAWIQFFKRSPLNFRPVALVPRGSNAKGLALIIRGLLNRYRVGGNSRYMDEACGLADIIVSQRARDRDYFCVGYDFFWEARAFSVPEFTPNMIVSSFAGQAFLDLYESGNDGRWLEYALEIGYFIEKELKLRQSDKEVVFGYIPGEEAIVYNVNLLAAAFFSRLYVHSNERKHREYAEGAADFTVNAQREDGAWPYGEEQYHRWIDNFHTGFNLVSLDAVRVNLSSDRWDDSIERGLTFHMRSHFLEDMTPKYYDTGLYPVDIHNFAQGIDTFLTFGDFERARKLLERSIDMMWDENKHYFYYQKKRWYKNRINYMRWSQAWMFYALTRFELHGESRRTRS